MVRNNVECSCVCSERSKKEREQIKSRYSRE